MDGDRNNSKQGISRREALRYIGGGVALTMTSGLPEVVGNTLLNERYNVILVLPDQLQADRLHCYGNPRLTSPNIDRLAQMGVRFSRFYSVAPWTAPSFGSLVTSRYPSVHGATLFKVSKDPLVEPKLPKLAEVFQQAGYKTVAFINNGVAGSQITGPGFEEYYERQDVIKAKNVVERDESQSLLTAPETTEQIKVWFERHQKEPFFMLINYFEPHSPYNPPPEHDLFKSDAYPEMTDTGYRFINGYLRGLGKVQDEKAIERLKQLYDGKIHFIDHYVGQLYDQLEKLGMDKKTLFVLTSDHGELLYAHPRDFLTTDHVSLYDSVMHIPFIMVGPGLPAGKVINAMASNLDTGPTALDFAGLPALEAAQGTSVMPLVRGEISRLHEFLYGEVDMGVPLRSVRTSRYKLTLDMRTGEKQLFDLKEDPPELNNVYWKKQDVAQRLANKLEEYMQENEPTPEVRQRRFEGFSMDEIADDMTPNGGSLLVGRGWQIDALNEHGHWDGGCFWAEKGDGTRVAILRAAGAKLGRYNLYVHYGRLPQVKVATNARFTIVTEQGTHTVRVNFAKAVGQWQPLGTYVNPRWVMVNNLADGAIIVDAIKFESA